MVGNAAGRGGKPVCFVVAFPLATRVRPAGTHAGEETLKRSIIAVLIAAAAPLALAQSPEEPAVIVTATRFPERGLDAPVGMIVIGAQEIARDTARTLPELLSHLGGVHTRDNSGSPDRQVDLRGFGITGDQNTLILLDGVRLNENDLNSTKLSAIPLQSIERIEILPGGSAVLFGGGTTGGTINIITKAPTPNQTSGSVFAGYGSYASADVRAGANYAGDRLGLALNAGHQESDNYRQNNRLRQDSLVGDVRYRDGETNAGLKFGADLQSLQLPGVRNEIEYANDPRGAQTPGNWSQRRGEFGTLSFGRPLGPLDFAADLGYRDNDSTAYFAPSINQITQRSLTFSPRVRLPFASLGFPSVLIAGLDWGDWNYDRQINFPGFPNSSTSGTQRSTGVYAQYSGQLTAATKLTLGARQQRATDHRVATGFGTSDQSQTQKPHAEELGVSHALSERWQVYGKLGTSFRVANVDENGLTVSGDLLKAQTARNREAGVEYRPRGAKVRASIYQIDLDNEIYFSPIVVAFGANTNLSPTRRSGAELSGQWSVTPTVELAGSFAYQVARFRTGSYGGVDVSGKDVPLVPKQLANLRLFWRVADRTQFGAAASYVGHQRYDNDQDNSFPRVMPAYALYDIKLTREWADWQYAAAINNLFDKKYFNYGLVDIFGQCGTPTCVYPQAGRVFFVSAEHAFR
jgi:iron complex outermembrane receptor protein